VAVRKPKACNAVDGSKVLGVAIESVLGMVPHKEVALVSSKAKEDRS
jgi:hypothetical protein